MDDNKTPPESTVLPEGMVAVPQADLTKIHEQLANAEKRDADRDAEIEGLRQMVSKGADNSSDGKLRERKTYEPKFRTVRIRKYPIAGNFENQGYVIGWTSRGAYQKVDSSGISKQIVDFIDVIFLGQERNAEGKLQAESVPLLDLISRGEQVTCKIVSQNRKDEKIPTGEEIDVTTWDPQHGLVATGDKIDGYISRSTIEYTIEVPGKGQVTVDGMYLN